MLADTKLFKDYTCYLTTSNENRKTVILYHKKEKTYKTLTYARYLLSLKENRLLETGEEADHINEDKTDDRIENLQILSRKDNIQKHCRSQKGIHYFLLRCPSCLTVFEKQYRNSFERKGSKFHCCSLKCLHIFLSIKQHSSSELYVIGENQKIKEFFRNEKTGKVTETDC